MKIIYYLLSMTDLSNLLSHKSPPMYVMSAYGIDTSQCHQSSMDAVLVVTNNVWARHTQTVKFNLTGVLLEQHGFIHKG